MKFVILEKTYTFTKYKGKQYVFYINPTPNELSASNETKFNRGIIDKDGNLYVEARILDETDTSAYRGIGYSDIMHTDMISFLRKMDENLFKGFDSAPVRGYDNWGLNKYYLSIMICVNRIGGTNKFELSEIYEIEVPSDTPIIKKAKKKNPSLKFIL